MLATITLFLSLFLAFTAQSENRSTEFSKCSQDSDCVWVAGDCCGFETIISSSYKAKWLEQLKAKCPSGPELACPSVIDEARIRNLPGCVNNSCRLNVIEDYAKRDVPYCRSLKRLGEQSSCFWTVALENKKAEICADIDDKIPFVIGNRKTSQACRVNVQNLRIQNGPVDQAFCDSFSDEIRYSRCIDRLASDTKDAQLCLKLRTEAIRQRCSSLVVNPTKGIEQCVPFLKENDRALLTMWGMCVHSTAVARKQPSICDSIYKMTEGKPDQKYWSWYNCVSGVATQNKDPDLCVKLKERLNEATPYHDEKFCRESVKREM